MALTPEEQAELNELKGLVAQLPEDIEPLPIAEKTFGSELAGGQESFMGNALQWGSDIVKAPINMISGLAGSYSQKPQYSLGPDGSLIKNEGPNVLTTEAAGNQVANPLRPAAGMIPGGATAYDALTTDKSGAELGAQLRSELANVPMLAIPPAIKAIKGAGTAVKDFTLGLPEENLLASQASNAEIYANKLNIGSKRTAGENQLLSEAANQADTFTRENPTAGIDPSGGRASFEQFQKNISDLEIEGVKTRNDILPQAAEAEAIRAAEARANGTTIKTGISFDDIPTVRETAKGPQGLEHISNTIPGGDAGVAMAKEFVEKEFGIGPEYPYGQSGPMVRNTQGRALSAQEANTTRMRIDNQIREFGGFDDNYWIQQNLNPSVGKSYVEALRFYRQQLDGAVKGHIADLLGPEKAKAFNTAGENISMAKTYGPMAERFKLETGQAFAPGSAKAVPPGKGPLGTSGVIGGVVDELAPGRATARMQEAALSREGNAIRQLQMLVDFKTGARSMPAPRGWAQIKSSVQDLTNIGTLAVQLGIIQNIDQLAQMPDAQAKQVVGLVAAQMPQAFAPTPDNVNVIDGVYQTPMDKDAVVTEALNADAETRANVIGASFENRYVPLAQSKQPIASTPASKIPDLNEIISSLDSPQEQTYRSDATDMVSKLDEAIARHGQDYIQ